MSVAVRNLVLLSAWYSAPPCVVPIHLERCPSCWGPYFTNWFSIVYEIRWNSVKNTLYVMWFHGLRKKVNQSQVPFHFFLGDKIIRYFSLICGIILCRSMKKTWHRLFKLVLKLTYRSLKNGSILYKTILFHWRSFSFQISIKLVLEYPINKTSALVHIMPLWWIDY